MKKLKLYLGNIIIALLIINNIEIQAQNTYYISSSVGDDRNDGQSGIPGDSNHGPWKTINKLNSIKLYPGDNILFKRGDSWNESLTINSSGNATSSIIFTTYGNGSLPKINCAEEITNWELYDSGLNIWRAKTDAGISSISQVFVNGERQTLARWPNTGWSIIDETASNGTYLIDYALNQSSGYWNGATLVIKGVLWEISEHEISFSTTNQLNLSSNIPYGGVATVEYGYYIENKFEELDNVGEYYFDDQNDIIYIVFEEGTSPSSYTIDASIRDNGIYLDNKDYITISNLEISKASKNGILCYNSDYLKIQGCSILDSKEIGGHFFSGDGSNLTFDNNTVSNVDIYRGVEVYNIENTVITNNNIVDITYDPASPRSASGIFIIGSPNSTVKNNVIKNIGSHGLHAGNGPVDILNNTFINCGASVQDNGAIYINGNHSASIIAYNRIKDCVGSVVGFPSWIKTNNLTVGLYCDETGYGATYHNNIVTNCGYGLKGHKSYNLTISNNVFYDNLVAGIHFLERSGNQMHNNDVYNNICYGENSSNAINISRDGSSTNPIGSFNNNIYYNPNLSSCIKHGSTSYSLSEWKGKAGNDSGNDKNSLSENPLFINASESDFQLQSNSPCIDAGDNSNVISEKDYYGKERIWGSEKNNNAIVDIGASEYGTPYVDNVTPNDSTECEGQNILVTDILILNEDELPYDYFGQIIQKGTSSGELVFSLTSSAGCDSIVELNVTIIPENNTETHGSVININLGAPSNFIGWNDFDPNNSKITELMYSNGSKSPYNFSLWEGWETSNGGDVSGNCYPDDVIRSYIFTSDNTIRYFSLDGLNNNKAYTLEFLSSRSSEAPGGRGAYFIVGSVEKEINAKGNTCELVALENIQPINGQIQIGYRKRETDSDGHVNALMITEKDLNEEPSDSTKSGNIIDGEDQPTSDNTLPIIILDYEESVNSGTVNTLVGSRSFDPNGKNLSYQWIAPEGVSVSETNGAVLTYLAPDVLIPTTKSFIFEVNDGIETSYKTIEITFTPYKPETSSIQVTSIKASHFDGNNHPTNLLDGDPNTYWSAKGDNHWIEMELGATTDISHLKVAFFGMQEKHSQFDVFLSQDNETWEPLFEDLESCGFSNEKHLVECASHTKSSATYKYVKIIGHGNDVDDNNMISELEVFGNLASTTSIIDVEQQLLKVYPNPASHFFTTELIDGGIVSLHDISGKNIFQRYIGKGKHTIPVDFPKGCYIISIQTGNNNIYNQKLMIE